MSLPIPTPFNAMSTSFFQQQQQSTIPSHSPTALSEPSNDYWIALWGMAEYFRQQNPPCLRHSMHCLMAIINSKPPPRIEIRAHLQLGSLLLKNTKQIELATHHFEQAMQLASSLTDMSDCYFEAASQVAKAFASRNKVQNAVNILQSVHQNAINSSYWNCRILLQLAQLALDDGNSKAAIYYLTLGEESATRFGAQFARIIFKLGHGMLLLVGRDFGGVDSVLGACSQLINQYGDSLRNKEVCKIMFLIMQTCHFLYASQVNTAANPLRQLQDALGTLMNMPAENSAFVTPNTLASSHDKFTWMNKDLLHIIVCTVTAMYELQAGRKDRVSRNFDKGMQALENYRLIDPKHPLLPRLQLVLLENLVQASLIGDRRSTAIECIGKMIAILPSCSERVSRRFESRVKLLLGFYYNAMGRVDVADWHLQSIQTQNLEAPDREMGYIVELSRSLLLCRMNRKSEATMVLQRFDDFTRTGRANPPALIKSAREYCIAVISLGHRKPAEARDSLVQAFQLAQNDGLSRMAMLARLLLGYVYLLLQNLNGARQELEQASQQAKATGDAELAVSSTRFLAEACLVISNMCIQQGAQQQAAMNEQMAQMFQAEAATEAAALAQDTQVAKSLPEHNNLMMWPQQNLVGSPPHINTTQPMAQAQQQQQQLTQQQQQHVVQQPAQVSPRLTSGYQQISQQSFIPPQQPAQMMMSPTQQQQFIQQQRHYQAQQQQFLLQSPQPGLQQAQQMAAAAAAARQFSPFSPPMYSSGVQVGLSPQQLMQMNQHISQGASNIFGSTMNFTEQQRR